MNRPSLDRTAEQLHGVAIRLLRLLRIEDTALGVGPAQLSALSVLVFAGPQSIGALARAEQIKVPTMSRIVDGLVAGGLARREAGAADRRVVSVAATRAGVALMHRGRSRRLKRFRALLRDLPDQDLRALHRAASILGALVR